MLGQRLFLAGAGIIGLMIGVGRADEQPDSGAAAAVPRPPAKLSPGERREQLQRLSDDLNSPDPLKRLATMESVLSSDDLLAADMTLQIALSSGDQAMRNYAGLLLLSRTKLVNIDVSYPASVRARLDAEKDDEKARDKLIVQNWPRVSNFVLDGHSVVSFGFHDFDLSSGAFKATCQQGPTQDKEESFDGQFSGGTLQFRGLCHLGRIHNIARYADMCVGTMELQGQGSFAGSLTCAGMEVPVAASFRLR